MAKGRRNRQVELYLEMRRNQNSKTNKAFRRFNNMNDAKRYVMNLNKYSKVLMGWRFGKDSQDREYYREPFSDEELKMI